MTGLLYIATNSTGLQYIVNKGLDDKAGRSDTALVGHAFLSMIGWEFLFVFFSADENESELQEKGWFYISSHSTVTFILTFIMFSLCFWLSLNLCDIALADHPKHLSNNQPIMMTFIFVMSLCFRLILLCDVVFEQTSPPPPTPTTTTAATHSHPHATLILIYCLTQWQSRSIELRTGSAPAQSHWFSITIWRTLFGAED